MLFAQRLPIVRTMTTHTNQHRHRHRDSIQQQDETALADLLDLDAEVLGSHLDEIVGWTAEWIVEQDAAHPRVLADLGAGTGSGTLALARRFPAADIICIDQSPLMLERLRTTTRSRGVADRVRLVEADLDVGWPDVGAVDLAWAALSLHHVNQPGTLLGELHDALAANGLLVVVEMDALPRFLPDDIGLGQPGLERRCHQAAALQQWNAHPDWRLPLQDAGFQVVAQRTFSVDVPSPPPSARRYAHAMLSRMRSALADRLSAIDRQTLDRLLSDDDSESVLSRRNLMLRSSRTAWAAQRLSESSPARRKAD